MCILFAWSLMLSRGTSEGRDDGKRTHRTYGGCPTFVTVAKAVYCCVYSHCSCGLDWHGVSSCFRRWQIRLWLAASVDLQDLHLIVGLTVTLLIVHGACEFLIDVNVCKFYHLKLIVSAPGPWTVKKATNDPERDLRKIGTSQQKRAEKTQRRPVFAKGLLTWVSIQVTGE